MADTLPAVPPTGWRDLLGEGRAGSFLFIMLGMWLMAADALVTATIMPSVGADLAGFAWFGWATSGFLVGQVVAGACVAPLTARLGLRRAMFGGGLALAAGCAVSALAPAMAWFVAGRIVQGAAAGVIGGLCYVAIGLVFPARHLPRVFAAATSVWGVATVIGPLVGGLFADAGAWRLTFWFFAVQALLFGLLVWRIIPKDARREAAAPVPVGPLLLLTAAIAAFAVAGVLADAVLAVVLAAIGVPLLVVAVRRDALLPAGGLLPKATLARGAARGSALGAAYLFYFTATAAATGFAVYAPAILQFTAGLNALEAGYVVAVEALAWTGLALLVAGGGATVARRSVRAGAVMVAAGVALLLVVMASGSVLWVAVGGGLLGGGFGLSFAFVSQFLMTSLPESEAAAGSAAIGTVRNSGGAVGAALASVAANVNGFAGGLSAGNVGGVAFWVFALALPLALVGLVAGWRLAGRLDQVVLANS
jgi:MFS family permease